MEKTEYKYDANYPSIRILFENNISLHQCITDYYTNIQINAALIALIVIFASFLSWNVITQFYFFAQ